MITCDLVAPLDPISGKRASAARLVSEGTLIGLADFTNGSTTPSSIYTGATWESGSQSGGTISVVDGYYHATYPIPTGATYTWLNFKIAPLNLYEFYLTFRARFTDPHSVKFCKVHGKEVGANYSNTTYQVTTAGVMQQILFGDGEDVSNDAERTIYLSGANPTQIGRSYGTATVLTPQGASFTGFQDEDWHDIKIHHKFNSGTTEENQIADGEVYLEIDGLVYVNATGLFNRHYASAPIDYIAFGDWAQDSDYAFEIDYDTIKISIGNFV